MTLKEKAKKAIKGVGSFFKKFDKSKEATQKQYEDMFGASPLRFTKEEKEQAKNLTSFMRKK